jgi:hypothetical protein
LDDSRAEGFCTGKEETLPKKPTISGAMFGLSILYALVNGFIGEFIRDRRRR